MSTMGPGRPFSAALVACSLLVPVHTAPQDPPASAGALFWAERFEEAAALYRQAVAADPSNGLAWLRLGISLRRMGRPEPALEALERARGLGASPPAVAFNFAAATAALGRADEAAAWLEKAADAGWSDAAAITADPGLGRLSEEPRVARAIERVRVNARPCEHDPERRQFDFWVGDWDVETAEGVRAGRNRITRSAGGCALLEQYDSARGPYTGASLNYFDPARRLWVQVWTDSGGSLIKLEGNLTKEGTMRLQGEIIDRAGRARPFRGTWTRLADGRVRQHFEESSDGGATWSTWFDGYYEKVQGAGAAGREP